MADVDLDNSGCCNEENGPSTKQRNTTEGKKKEFSLDLRNVNIL
jgi:hypothetical protein